MRSLLLHHGRNPQSLFDVYALALPAGLAFGDDTRIGARLSESSETCVALTRNANNGMFGCLVMRCRVDDVWHVLRRDVGMSKSQALDIISTALQGNPSRKPIPPGVPYRSLDVEPEYTSLDQGHPG